MSRLLNGFLLCFFAPCLAPSFICLMGFNNTFKMILISINFYNLEFCRFVSLHAKENERTSSWSNGTAIICVHYLFSFFLLFKIELIINKRDKHKNRFEMFLVFFCQSKFRWLVWFYGQKKKCWKATTTTTRNFFWQEFYFQIFGICCFLFGIVISLDQNRLETERKKEVQNHDKTIFVSGNTTRILRQFCFAQSSGQLRVMLCMVAYFFVLFCFFLLWATNSLSDIAVHLFSSFAHTLSTIAQCVEQRWEFLWFFLPMNFFFRRNFCVRFFC